MAKNISKYMAVPLWGLILLLSGCKESGPDANNPSSPVVVNRFYPTSGGAGTEILITGKNFTEDASQVSVKLGNISLPVIGSSMTNIMVVVPKRLGNGKLEISIGGREAVSTLESFTYIFSAMVTTLAGTGEPGYADGDGDQAMFHFDDSTEGQGWRKGAICVDNEQNVYVGDIVNSCIRKINPDGEVSTLAGMQGVYASQDGVGSTARFQDIYGMDCDADGNIFLTDVIAWQIRQVTPQGVVTTIAGTQFQPWYLAVDRRNGDLYITSETDGNGGVWKWDGTDFTRIYTGKCGAVVVAGDGYVYVSNIDTHQIIRLTPDTWAAEVFAGSAAGFEDGSLLSARFSSPRGLAMDSNGDIYVAGNGTWNGGDNADQSIRRIDMAAGKVIAIAGGGHAGYVDANGTAAAFSGPQDLTVDKDGAIYVLDKMNNAVRKIVYE